ncbi:MAG: YcaQ family DNA glycosylase [Actinobacteria bacterium]|nr:YcaQ family DNA glycosylase [Actinomycetota bacterium]MBV8959517.1 YcaQ family DNA glycosylase [Actinomycetota bacterium]
MAGDSTIRPMLELSRDEARRLFLRAQGVLGAPDRRAGVPGVLRHVGAVQLDTISVLARSHELVAYARLGAVGRAAVERAYWSRPASAFEYWAHAACILPIEDWPWFEGRRRRYRTQYPLRHGADAKAVRQARARLADGPVTTTDLGGGRREPGWWKWSAIKAAVESLLMHGEVVVTERRAWKRVYDLAERAIPAELRDKQPSDAECNAWKVAAAGTHYGVATRADLADYYRLKKAWVDESVGDTGLVPVRVRGWSEPAWADPVLLQELADGQLRGRHRTTLLSPFDSLVWDRAHTLRMFGFTHVFEAYVPAAKRQFGYYAMPVLAGGRIVGQVDPSRQGTTLVARRVSLESPAAVASVASALREAATWVGCDSVVVESVEQPELRRRLQAALAG